MKVNVYDLNGKPVEKIELPKVFNEQLRPDLIIRAVTSLQSKRRQPYGPDPLAGLRSAAHYHGRRRARHSMMMRDMDRLPRLHATSPMMAFRVRKVPSAVKGRKAHPPKVEKNWNEKINKKEKILAKKSAIAATADKEIVTKRGHKFDNKITLPIVVDDKFQKIQKTKDVIKILDKIGIYNDIIRAENGKHIRSGKGKSRGRKYKIPKSLLIVSTEAEILKSSKNLIGVDVVTPKEINIEHLAPGGDAGRLTVFTKSAIKEIGGAK